MVVLKIGISIVTFVVAGTIFAKFGTDLGLVTPGAVGAFGLIPGVSFIVPIWYFAPPVYRIAAAGGGIIAGIAMWLLALSIPEATALFLPYGSYEHRITASILVGVLGGGSWLVSLIVCVAILRAGRKQTR